MESLALGTDALLPHAVLLPGQLCLWDFQKGVLLARASAQTEIMAAIFTADGSIVSAGREHLKVCAHNMHAKQAVQCQAQSVQCNTPTLLPLLCTSGSPKVEGHQQRTLISKLHSQGP